MLSINHFRRRILSLFLVLSQVESTNMYNNRNNTEQDILTISRIVDKIKTKMSVSEVENDTKSAIALCQKIMTEIISNKTEDADKIAKYLNTIAWSIIYDQKLENNIEKYTKLVKALRKEVKLIVKTIDNDKLKNDLLRGTTNYLNETILCIIEAKIQNSLESTICSTMIEEICTEVKQEIQDETEEEKKELPYSSSNITINLLIWRTPQSFVTLRQSKTLHKAIEDIKTPKIIEICEEVRKITENIEGDPDKALHYTVVCLLDTIKCIYDLLKKNKRSDFTRYITMIIELYQFTKEKAEAITNDDTKSALLDNIVTDVTTKLWYIDKSPNMGRIEIAKYLEIVEKFGQFGIEIIKKIREDTIRDSYNEGEILPIDDDGDIVIEYSLDPKKGQQVNMIACELNSSISFITSKIMPSESIDNITIYRSVLALSDLTREAAQATNYYRLNLHILNNTKTALEVFIDKITQAKLKVDIREIKKKVDEFNELIKKTDNTINQQMQELDELYKRRKVLMTQQKVGDGKEKLDTLIKTINKNLYLFDDRILFDEFGKDIISEHLCPDSEENDESEEAEKKLENKEQRVLGNKDSHKKEIEETIMQLKPNSSDKNNKVTIVWGCIAGIIAFLGIVKYINKKKPKNLISNVISTERKTSPTEIDKTMNT